MRGRAGRKGKDMIGQSFLCCERNDVEEVVQLLEADLPCVGSSLTPERRGIKRYESQMADKVPLTDVGHC